MWPNLFAIWFFVVAMFEFGRGNIVRGWLSVAFGYVCLTYAFIA